jgi:DNA-directed RNA polymerase II subunit RPB2
MPSRMTIAQPLESVMGKIGSIVGHEMDATPFNKIDPNKLGDMLEEYGFNRHGTEIMYCGFSGRKLKTPIFIGMTYYQKLKHMVEDKIHSRTTGPVNILTRQPTEGKIRHGGLKLGEMERDCLISYGSAQFLKERTMECSDKYIIHVCELCGLIASKELEQDIWYCKSCNSYKTIMTEVPYAFKLLIQEQMAMLVAPRLRF